MWSRPIILASGALYPMTTERNCARKVLDFGHDVSVSAKPSFRIIRFSTFELNLQTGELHQQGRKLKLQEQSFQVLAALLERPGEVVTRDELRNKLWPADTFVDFDHSLNAAIKRLRDALGESPEAPVFIETLARRGYRFIAPVNGCSAPSEIGIATAPEQSKSSFLRHWVTNAGGGILESPLFRETLPQARRLRLVYGVVLLLFLITVAIGWWLLSRRVPRVTTSTQLSFSGRIHAPTTDTGEWYSTLATDGTRIYSSASTK
jgi:DNA-binding winged helix-turn-helix (wHTH) protein